MTPLQMNLLLAFTKQQITGTLTFTKDTDSPLELLIDTLTITSITSNSTPFPFLPTPKITILNDQNTTFTIKFTQQKIDAEVQFPQLLGRRLALNISASTDFGTLLKQNSQFARTVKFVVIPPHFQTVQNVVCAPDLNGLALALIGKTDRKIVLCQGSLSVKYVDSTFVFYVPGGSQQVVLALFKAAKIVLPVLQNINLAASAVSSVFCQALLYHFFFGFLAADNYSEFYAVVQSLLAVNIKQPDALAFHSQFSDSYYPFAACLALASTSLNNIQQHALFSQTSSQNAHNDMLKSAFEVEKSKFCSEIFPKQGIEPGNLLKAAIEQVPADLYNFDVRRFIVLGGQEFLIQFLAEPSWELKLNQLADKVDNEKYAKSAEIQSFNTIISDSNEKIKQQFANMQVFCQLYNNKEKIEGKDLKTTFSQSFASTITLQQSYYNKHYFKYEMYNDSDLTQISSPTDLFKQYGKDQLCPITTYPIFYEEISFKMNGIVQMLLEFNHIQEHKKIGQLDKICFKLFQVFRNCVYSQYAKQTFISNFIEFKDQFIQFKSLFNNDKTSQILFSFIEDLKKFLRGILLNIENRFELREKSVKFLIYLDDMEWLNRIIDYLENRFGSCLDNQDQVTLNQIKQLIDSMWLGVVLLKRESYLLTLLVNDLFQPIWLSRLSYAKVSKYLISIIKTKNFDTDSYNLFLLNQIFYHDQQELIEELQLTTTLSVQIFNILLLYPRKICEQMLKFIYKTFDVQSVSQFINTIAAEISRLELVNIWVINKAPQVDKFNNDKLCLYLGKFDFLDWNLSILPRILMIFTNIYQFSDYSCYNCYFGSCKCNLKANIQRNKVDDFDFAGYQYIGSIQNEFQNENRQVMDQSLYEENKDKIQICFGDIILHQRNLD